MLKAFELSKNYNGQTALDALNLNIEAGEVYCLLGANGAGKTTTINLFLNFISPGGGKALINGLDVAENPWETKKYLAYIPEQVNLYQRGKMHAAVARPGREVVVLQSVVKRIRLVAESFKFEKHQTR